MFSHNIDKCQTYLLKKIRAAGSKPKFVIVLIFKTKIKTLFFSTRENILEMISNQWVQSLLFILSFSVLGLGTALLGPSLPDLAYSTNSKISEYTSVFFGRAIGFLIGKGLYRSSIVR